MALLSPTELVMSSLMQKTTKMDFGFVIFLASP
jgi:hypothetical protein